MVQHVYTAISSLGTRLLLQYSHTIIYTIPSYLLLNLLPTFQYAFTPLDEFLLSSIYTTGLTHHRIFDLAIPAITSD